jgi:hypothetical protein
MLLSNLFNTVLFFSKLFITIFSKLCETILTNSYFLTRRVIIRLVRRKNCGNQ